jgi:hypothetical protein
VSLRRARPFGPSSSHESRRSPKSRKDPDAAAT